jgi:elongation factor P
MANTSDFRSGFAFEWRDDVWQITDFQHVKPGKGGAFVRTSLKNVRDGRVQNETFRAGEKVEQIRVERRPHQYLYTDDYGLHFMNTETYEQFALNAEHVAGRDFLKEGGTIDILFRADTDEPLNTEQDPNVDLVVADTDPGLKGDTAQGGSKPAILESGAVVDVPLFIEEGDVVRVSTGSGEYVTRVST